MANKKESRDEADKQISPAMPTDIDVLQKEFARTQVLCRTMLQFTPDAMVITDENHHIVDFNEKYLEVWKIPAEVLKNGEEGHARKLASQQVAHPEEFITRAVEILTSEKESFDILNLKDGRIFERYSQVLFVQGQNTGRIWGFREVTERYLAEVTSRRLAAIVASSDDAIIGKDLTSTITSWNAGAERIFGYTAEEMIGASIMRLIPSDRQDEERDILARIRRNERLDHFETIRMAKDGRKLNVSVTVSPIKDSTGNIIGASKVARDITERKAAEAALKKAVKDADRANRERLELLDSEREARSQAERASRMKDEFLATLSHELRTPLNAVLGWAGILRLGKLEGAELKKGLETIERNARVQAQIIEGLLDMSRIMSGKVRLDVQRIDLSAILNESIDTVRATAEAKGIRLQTVIDPFINPMSGDPNRLQQVFWNLLNNAIKFTPKDGRVLVMLERVNSHIEISVIDTGEGIAPEFLPYVFDRFQQADASSTRQYGGLGLGLAIVKQLVELHGGEVRVKSGGLGEGATFTVKLPLLAVHAEPETDRRHPRTPLMDMPPLPAISLTDVRVLVVDDEADARELVRRLLEMAGAKVSMAASAAEAMESILAAPPDVLICDIGMPKEDGYSLIQKLRARKKKEENALPAIALTAYARAEDRTKAIRSGFQNHLAKPVEAAELLAIVSSLAGPRENHSSQDD
ncbi:MAG: PAS domain S-box protein [Chthoniobacterales bacterium]